MMTTTRALQILDLKAPAPGSDLAAWRAGPLRRAHRAAAAATHPDTAGAAATDAEIRALTEKMQLVNAAVAALRTADPRAAAGAAPGEHVFRDGGVEIRSHRTDNGFTFVDIFVHTWPGTTNTWGRGGPSRGGKP